MHARLPVPLARLSLMSNGSYLLSISRPIHRLAIITLSYGHRLLGVTLKHTQCILPPAQLFTFTQINPHPRCSSVFTLTLRTYHKPVQPPPTCSVTPPKKKARDISYPASTLSSSTHLVGTMPCSATRTGPVGLIPEAFVISPSP